MADHGDNSQHPQHQQQPEPSTSALSQPEVPSLPKEPAVMGAEASEATAASTSSHPASQASSDVTTHESSDGPAVPPREYSRDVRLLQYHAPTPRLPSQFLPRFVKYLALFIFISGTSATLVTVLYQRYLLPKLLLAKQRVTALQRHNLASYEKLVESLRTLVSQNSLLYPYTSAFLDTGASLQHKDAETDTAEATAESQEAADEKQSLLEEANPEQPPRVHVTKDLQISLSRLTSLLSAHNARLSDKSDTSQSHLPEPSAAQSCLSSIESFSTYVTNESFYASAPSYPASAYGYGYGASTGLNTMSGANKEMLTQVKNDIRSLKGSFLTRRNFATPKSES